jgi:5-formyltetrahydrofolate cyclo-ligase
MHMATKDEIRKQMREQRRHVDETSRKTTGKAVCEKVIGHPVNLLPRA